MPRPGRGEARVRVAATAVCHTDLSIYLGTHPGVRYPVVMGHEATGVVESVGPDVARLRPGQRVLLNPVIACGACDCCARGQGNLCRTAGLFGREIDGSLAEHVVLPEGYLYPLPEHVPLVAATLIETLATVRHAQQRARIAPGESVVVLGQGAAGLLHTRLAKLSGADPVVAVSRSAWKLELARRMKADRVVDAARQDVLAEVSDATGGRGADVVIDAAGQPALIASAIDMLCPGGRLLMYGISQQPVPGFSTFPFYFKELTLYGSRALTPDDFEPAIGLVASGAIDVAEFVTRSYPLARVAAAFEEYERAPDAILRLVIVPGE
ncbi:MAG: alcohol dehydrogenase catalytic domain-containing protein [Candidatus Rokubacteria bacterium]|nr:alcohol dehydrogenase catalytic domain-containing protein [Candidatus Rokubacteria bacterium]